MQDGQKLQSSSTSRIQFLEEKFNKINGKIEEGDHKNSKFMKKNFKQLQERILVLETSIKTSDKTLTSLEKKFKKQEKYIKNVLKTLKGLSSTGGSSRKSSLYQRAMKNYRSKRYKTAKKQLTSLASNKSLKKSQQARVIHNLGMISYIQKNDKESVIYFGRLFTKYPKSSYNKNGLFFMAKSFRRQKKIAQAKETLKEIIRRYPKSKQAKQSKKLLKTI